MTSPLSSNLWHMLQVRASHQTRRLWKSHIASGNAFSSQNSNSFLHMFGSNTGKSRLHCIVVSQDTPKACPQRPYCTFDTMSATVYPIFWSTNFLSRSARKCNAVEYSIRFFHCGLFRNLKKKLWQSKFTFYTTF